MLKHARDIKHLAALVYFTQGAVGITSIALPLYLRQMGWSIGAITTTSSIIALPWILKIFYGLLSDCLPLAGYRRKSYLMLFPVISGAGWFVLSVIQPDRPFVIAALLAANLGYAATDVITDGLVVEHSTLFTTHVYQSIAWGARSAGAIVSSALGGWLTQHLPPQSIFFIAAFLPLGTVFVAMQILEKKQTRIPFSNVKEPLKRCARVLMTRRMFWFVLFLILMQSSACYGVPFFFYMREGLHFSESFLGILLSLGWGGAVVGSLLYGHWLSHWKLENVVRFAILVNLANSLSILFIFNKISAVFLVFLGGWMACITILPIMAACAVFSRNSGVEGTLFAILASIYNLGQMGFAFLGGKMHAFLGLKPLILFAAAITLCILLLLPRLKLQETLTPEHSG